MIDDGLTYDGLATIQLLGPAQIRGAAGTVTASGKDALFLAELTSHQGSAVSSRHLIEELWGDAPPRDPSNAVQVRASRLRGLLRAAAGTPGADLLRARSGSYALAGVGLRSDVGAAEQDALAAGRAAAAGEWRRALELAERAEQAWRGELLGGAPLSTCLAALSDRLTEARLAAVETALAAELALGRPDSAVRRAVPLLSRHPYRERLHALVIRALAQTDRSGEALAHYAALRDRLVRELGTEPGPELRALHGRILRDELRGEPRDPEPERRSAAAGVPAAAPPPTPPTVPLWFVGRRAELDEIRRALTDSRTGERTAVVSGMPGIGKTALALAAARSLRDEFPDGQVFLRVGRDADGGIRELLARSRTLVVLDDVRSAAQLRRLLPAEPQGAVLITSQSLLSASDVSVRIRLSPLALTESVAMLQNGAAGPSELDSAVARKLAELCGRLPLALRVVAARLALAGDHSGDPPARRLAENLADRRARSVLLEFDDLSVRRALLRPIRRLDHSGRRLDRAAATALRCLAKDAADSWSPPSAAQALVAPGWNVVDVLDRLLEMSLLETVGGRLRMHPLLRDVLSASDSGSPVQAASASSARRGAGFLQSCQARSSPVGVIRPRRARREGEIMQLETCGELSETEELELTADAAESADGPDWILFSW